MTSERKGLAFFIDRPVLAWVINLLIILSGLVSLLYLQLRDQPNVRSNMLQITANYNADSQEFERTITKKITDAISGIPGLIETSTHTTNKHGTINCYFAKNANMLEATLAIMRKISYLRANHELPKDMREPEIAGYGVSNSDNVTAIVGELIFKNIGNNSEYIEQLKQLLSNIPGAGAAEIYDPSETKTMILHISPVKMQQNGINYSQLGEALYNNTDIHLGEVLGPNQKREVYLKGSVTIEKLLDIQIRNNKNKLVRLGDVAELKPKIIGKTLLDGKQFIYFSVSTRADGNPVNVSKEAIKVLNEAKSVGELEYRVLDNTGEKIENELNTLWHTLFETIAIVLLIVGLVLGSWRMSLVILVTLPVSIIGTFSIMLLAGCSINYTTLLALIVAIGLVVDDAIIVGENNLKVLASKKFNDLKDAAAYNISNIQWSIIGMTLILVTVYIPIYFVSSLEERAIQELVITLASAVCFSGIVALVLSPAMCARLLSVEEATETENSIIFEFLNKIYNKALTKIIYLNKRVLRIISLLFIISGSLVSYHIYVNTQKETQPPTRTSQIRFLTNMTNDTTVAKKQQYLKALTEKCKESLGDRYDSVVKFIIGRADDRQQAHIDIYLQNILPAGIEGNIDKIEDYLYKHLSQVPNGHVHPPRRDQSGTASFYITSPNFNCNVYGSNGFLSQCKKIIGLHLEKYVDPGRTMHYASSNEAYFVSLKHGLILTTELRRLLSEFVSPSIRIMRTANDIKLGTPSYDICLETGEGNANELIMPVESIENVGSGKYQFLTPRAYLENLLEKTPLFIQKSGQQGEYVPLANYVTYELKNMHSYDLYNGKRAIHLVVTLRTGVTPQTFIQALKTVFIDQMPGVATYPSGPTKSAIRDDSITSINMYLAFLSCSIREFLRCIFDIT